MEYPRYQTTLKREILLEGTNVYNGCTTTTMLAPAEPHRGIRFVVGDEEIPASLESARAEGGALVLAGRSKEVRQAEHILAAFYLCGVDNATIVLDEQSGFFVDNRLPFIHTMRAGVPPTIPGVAAPYIRAIHDAGIETLTAERNYLSAKSLATVSAGRYLPDTITIGPEEGNVTIDACVEYKCRGIPRQEEQVTLGTDLTSVAEARSPTLWLPRKLHRLFFSQPVRSFHGVNEHNYLITSGNPNDPYVTEPYSSNEIAKHKVLDYAGVLALLGLPLRNTGIRLEKTGMQFDIIALRRIVHEGVLL